MLKLKKSSLWERFKNSKVPYYCGLVTFCFLISLILTSCDHKHEFKAKTKLDRIHKHYLDQTVGYLQNVVMAYPCDIKHPPMPKIVVAKTGEIGRYCPEFARACYSPLINKVWYEEGDYEALKHELAHAVLSYNPQLSGSCWQELILQQMDHILKDKFDGKRGRWAKPGEHKRTM